MDLLTIGLLIFFGTHLMPSIVPLRAALVEKLGKQTYVRVFSVVSLLGLIVTGVGYAIADYQYVWQPPMWGKQFALYSMPLAFILFVAVNDKTHIRKFFRHPMSLGVFIWALGHLLSTRDLASIKLFGVFAFFAIFWVISTELRKKKRGEIKPDFRQDLTTIAIGLVLYAAFFFGHGLLFGAPLS